MQSIFTPNTPKPIGPYSQAMKTGNLLFVSGQIPLEPATGKIVSGTIQDQAERAILNVEGVLAAAGVGKQQVVKTTIYLTDIREFAQVNEVYAKHFREPYPARAVVQVAALPAGAAIEIEAVAELSGSGIA